jgi:hypothetical protein
VSRTLEPVTVGGWYEHDDGSVVEYLWIDGGLRQTRTAASWADVPERDYAADDRAARVAS